MVRMVAVIAKPKLVNLTVYLQRIVDLVDLSIDVVMPSDGHHAVDAGSTKLQRVTYIPTQDIAHYADMLIVLGGDGTIIYAASLLKERKVPILGVNMGRVGFLAAITADELESVLPNAIQGKLPCIDRTRLQVTLSIGGQTFYSDMVLNEVVVAVRALARMGHFEIFYNEEHLTVVRGDGVIISTSTGSTAYNLAAGGPIVAPDVDAITLTPICSHQLNQRCLVVSPYAVLKIVLNSENSAFVSLDGQRGYAIERGDFIQIHRAKVPAQLFYQPTQSYFATLRSKLGWGKEYHPVSSSVVPGS